MNCKDKNSDDDFEKEITEDAAKNKMIFIMATAVTYCITMTILCGVYFYSLPQTLGPKDVCYANSSNVPVESGIPAYDNVDVTARFRACLQTGFWVHLLGVFGDSSYLLQIKTITNKGFRIFAFVLVTTYSVLWLAWLIWANVLRFRHVGQVCSTDLLPADERGDLPWYAYTEGKYLLNVIIALWTINGILVVLAIIASVFEKRYIA